MASDEVVNMSESEVKVDLQKIALVIHLKNGNTQKIPA